MLLSDRNRLVDFDLPLARQANGVFHLLPKLAAHLGIEVGSPLNVFQRQLQILLSLIGIGAHDLACGRQVVLHFRPNLAGDHTPLHIDPPQKTRRRFGQDLGKQAAGSWSFAQAR